MLTYFGLVRMYVCVCVFVLTYVTHGFLALGAQWGREDQVNTDTHTHALEQRLVAREASYRVSAARCGSVEKQMRIKSSGE